MPKFVPRERKHKVRQRNEKIDSNIINGGTTADSNAIEILADPNAGRDRRRKLLRANLRAQQPRISAKKRKRLDKYVDKKLQREENLDFIKKLADSRVDTSLLQSSRSLGGRKSNRDVLSQAVNETRTGVNLDSNCRLIYEDPSDESDASSLSDRSESGDRNEIGLDKPNAPALGSGLKRALNLDDNGYPILKKRKRSSKVRPIKGPETEPSWEGFSSDELENEGHSEPSSPTFSFEAQTKTNDGSLEKGSSQGSEESESSRSEDDHEDDEDEQTERSSTFKSWATQQINESLGFIPTGALTNSPDVMASHPTGKEISSLQPRPPELDPLPPELQLNSSAPARQVYHVDVVRSADIQEARLALPVVAEEQKIMEAVHSNPAVVIWGATGSGKTTQVPQFLFEAGYGSPDSSTPGMIGVTQPRRVAAVSMANRVANELGQAREKVSYQIRFDSSVSEKTAIKFMTDGILIQEIAHDFALRKYSVIIIDEAHERSANTDILIGMVSRIVDLRASMNKDDQVIRPLKMIIMSATLRVNDFLNNANLFRNGPPPLIKAEGRQFPVTTHFARRTQRDYLEEVFAKVSRGHKNLPPGGMLIFLTGQNEITTIAERLKEAFAHNQESLVIGKSMHLDPSELPIETEDLDVGHQQYDVHDVEEGDISNDDFSNDDDDDHEFDLEDSAPASSKVHILPLYSQLQTKDQLRVFQKPPPNARMIVLATNVAETSLTIPGIRYVFDTGRAKEKRYDRFTGVQSFEINWISKASASQRAGRAGRTGPGHCYRLYSSAVYERDFAEHAEPEILRMPVEGVVLQLKSMDLQHVVNFPFPTPPGRQSLAKAEKLLCYLGAISLDGKVTNVGRELSNYPLSPRFSKMLTIGHQHGCMSYTIVLVAALATPSLFLLENQITSSPSASYPDGRESENHQDDEARTKAHSAYNHAHHLFSRHSSTSDALKALTALCAYAYSQAKEDFCKDMFLSPKATAEASNLSSQLMAIVRNNKPNLLLQNPGLRLPSPSKTQISALQQITAAAFIDQIAILHSAHPSPPDLPRKPTRAIDVPYLPLFPITGSRRRTDIDIIDVAVFIHPSSVLARLPVKELPTYIVYAHLQRGTPSTVDGSKKPRTRMYALGVVSGKQTAGLARGTPLLVYGKPIGKIEEVEAGLRRCWVVPSLVGEKGGIGWPLPAQDVLQRKDGKGEWVVEKVLN